MKRVSLLSGLILLTISSYTLANNEVAINTKQLVALGITTSSLPAQRTGEVPGLPAQVIIPGNQLFVISSPLAAMIEQTLVGVGDSVNKGQVIARLQSPALAEAQRGLLQTSVQNEIAQENMKRDTALLKDGIISESRFRATRAIALEARAALSERKQMLKFSGMPDSAIARLQSGNDLGSLLIVTSPIDGVVLEKSASAGQRLDAAVPIFKIGKLTPLALEIQAPLDFARHLNIGAVITIPAYNATGKLTAIGRSLTGTNQTILLRGVIVQGAENLRPGQFVEASISTGTNDSTQWNIPNSAISRIEGKAVVFTETAKGFRSVAVTVITQGAQNSLVSGSFKGDEKIAVSGVSALKASVLGIGGAE